MYLYDMRPQRLPQRKWTIIKDYLVIDARGLIVECPKLDNLRHLGYSRVFDNRIAYDALEGVNRAKH